MSYETTGTVIHIGHRQQINDTFAKRVVVIEVVDGDQGQYKQEVPLELANRACDFADNVTIGDTVEAVFSVRGRGWTPRGGGDKKWFASLNCFVLRKLGGELPEDEVPPPPLAQREPQPGSAAPPAHTNQQGAPTLPTPADTVDDIPF